MQHLCEVDGTVVKLLVQVSLAELLQEYEFAWYTELLAYRTVNFSTAPIALTCREVLKARKVVYEADMRVVGVTDAVVLEALATEHVL